MTIWQEYMATWRMNVSCSVDTLRMSTTLLVLGYESGTGSVGIASSCSAPARKGGSSMRRTLLFMATTALTLLVACGVALAASVNCPNASGGYCYGTPQGD